MATPQKQKRPKGRKKPQGSSSDQAVADAPPELEIPQVPEAAVDSDPPPVKVPKLTPSPAQKSPPKMTVRPVLDPKTKVTVTGRVSINFKYGPQGVSLRKGKKTMIPAAAVEHCRRLKYI